MRREPWISPIPPWRLRPRVKKHEWKWDFVWPASSNKVMHFHTYKRPISAIFVSSALSSGLLLCTTHWIGWIRLVRTSMVVDLMHQISCFLWWKQQHSKGRRRFSKIWKLMDLLRTDFTTTFYAPNRVLLATILIIFYMYHQGEMKLDVLVGRGLNGVNTKVLTDSKGLWSLSSQKRLWGEFWFGCAPGAAVAVVQNLRENYLHLRCKVKFIWYLSTR